MITQGTAIQLLAPRNFLGPWLRSLQAELGLRNKEIVPTDVSPNMMNMGWTDPDGVGLSFSSPAGVQVMTTLAYHAGIPAKTTKTLIEAAAAASLFSKRDRMDEKGLLFKALVPALKEEPYRMMMEIFVYGQNGPITRTPAKKLKFMEPGQQLRETSLFLEKPYRQMIKTTAKTLIDAEGFYEIQRSLPSVDRIWSDGVFDLVGAGKRMQAMRLVCQRHDNYMEMVQPT